MADDLDDMIRHAMKTLDASTPAGYFEALPNKALQRLEDGSSMEMQGNRSNDASSATDTAPHLMMPPEEVEKAPTTGTPPKASAAPAKDVKEEDSGLHDIRNLAGATKARISSRRSTQHPVVSDDDLLASSSAGWKAVALPEPAKMISLPELSALPSAVEIEKKDKTARAEAKKAAAPSTTVAAADPSTATAAELSAPMIGARLAQPTPGRGKLFAVVGVLTAAAAGTGIYMMMAKKDAPAAQIATTDKPAPAPVPTPELRAAPVVAPIPEEPPAPPVAPDPVPAPVEAAAAIPAVEEPKAKKEKEPKEKTHKVEIRDTVNVDKPAPAKPAKVDVAAPAPKEKGDEPSFDALLQEAGVQDVKKEVKPTLDKKSLSSSDFKSGMASVNGKAQGCYQGTQGTASVKLTIAPSGEVSKVSVSGQFAGTPVAACVESAVKGAKFPAWDGAPQSFGYSYLLAE